MTGAKGLTTRRLGVVVSLVALREALRAGLRGAAAMVFLVFREDEPVSLAEMRVIRALSLLLAFATLICLPI